MHRTDEREVPRQLFLMRARLSDDDNGERQVFPKHGGLERPVALASRSPTMTICANAGVICGERAHHHGNRTGKKRPSRGPNSRRASLDPIELLG